MRTMDRNKEPMWYAKLKEVTKILDDNNYETGEYNEVYYDAKKVWVHTQPVDSDLEVQKFGIESRDTLWVLIQRTDWDMDEATALWFKTTPTLHPKPTHRIAGIMPGLNQYVIYAKEL